MADTVKVIDYDIIYLSYDEPNAEKNYADLVSKVPWAKRVHGVKGSDAAHKECARISETDRFITVDGDNTVKEDFLNQELSFINNKDMEKCVVSWVGKNTINGLMYGNGGLKLWPKEYVLNMRTHENADPDNEHAQVDFCWDAEYIQMNKCFSDVHNNASPYQAWRAGFREGVKLALDRGVKPDKKGMLNNHWRCLHWLYVWTMIGSDVENGNFAILGARHGLHKTMLTDWDHREVRDFDILTQIYNDEIKGLEEKDVNDASCLYTFPLVTELGLPIDDPLSSGQSKFFKAVYQNPRRTDKPAYDE